jgi:hypothetical protein
VAADALGIQSLLEFSAAVVADIVQNVDLKAFRQFLGFSSSTIHSGDLDAKLDSQWPFPLNKEVKREKIILPLPSPLDVAQACKLTNQTKVPSVKGFLAILDCLPLKKVQYK